MASDEDYAAFLDKANQDPADGGGVKSSSKKDAGKLEFKTLDAGAEVPEKIKTKTSSEEWIYISDADEPFVPVSLKFDGGKLPDEKQFAKLINHPAPKNAGIQIQDISTWDPQGQYTDVVDAVREACGAADVRVYRVESEGARMEYWVVGVHDGRVVGVKALAVES